jgi:DNA polymerase III delta prime subunit
MSDENWTIKHLDPQEMVEVMKRYVELPSELDYYLVLEFSVLSRLRDFLPDDIYVYLLFYGPSGTGKSHAAQLVTEISGGEWLQAVSEGALLAGVSSGGLIGIDEIDGQSKRIEATEDILRVGHTWNAIYRKMVTKGNDHEPKDIKCGGPKVLTSIGVPEEGLASRCYAIEMSKSSKSLEFIVKWPYRSCDLAMIRESLDIYAQEIKDAAGTWELEK